MLRRLVREFLEGLRAGLDVLAWGQAYPRTFPIKHRGGWLPPRQPRRGERLVVLSPGRQITDPDDAEALGMPATARRLREQEGRL